MSALASHPIQGSPDGSAPCRSTVSAPHGRPDALATLREATQERHARLDNALPLGSHEATLHDYAQHLQAVRDWLAAFGPVLDGTHAPTAWAGRQAQRLDRILQDLKDCATIDPASITTAPLAALPGHALAGAAGFAWGVAYVVEGSQLGGTVLYRRLRERLAPHPLRYLRGDEAGSGWPAFLTDLRHALATPQDVADACTGACLAFDRLMARFRQVGVAI